MCCISLTDCFSVCSLNDTNVSSLSINVSGNIFNRE